MSRQVAQNAYAFAFSKGWCCTLLCVPYASAPTVVAHPYTNPLPQYLDPLSENVLNVNEPSSGTRQRWYAVYKGINPGIYRS